MFCPFRVHFEQSGYSGPFQIAVDATPVIQTVRVSLEDNLMYGLCCGPVQIGSYEHMENVIRNNKLTTQVYAFVMTPLVEGIDPYTLAVVAQEDKESSETVSDWEKVLTQKAIYSGVHLLGFAGDGDSKVRKHWTNCIGYQPGDDMDGGGLLSQMASNTEHFVLQFPDSLHIIKKLRNQLLNMKRLLLIGKDLIMLEHLRDMWHSNDALKLESNLWNTDIYVSDKQNVDAALRMFSENTRYIYHTFSNRGPGGHGRG